MLALAIAMSLAAELDRTKPTVYFINQNPTSAYYGNPAARYFADNGYSVLSSYLEMDSGKSQELSPHIFRIVLEDIKRVSPDLIFVMGTGFSPQLKASTDIPVVIFTLDKDDANIPVADPIAKLVTIVNSFDIEGDFYILRDNSSKSYRFAALYRKLLEQNGVRDRRIKFIDSSDTVGLERNLRRLNSEPTSVLLNCMYVLLDQEAGKYRYIEDIKGILTRVNKRHLDVGSYVGYGKSESIVLQLDYSKMNYKSKEVIPVLAFYNTNRLDRLGFKDHYIRAFNLVDGVIDE